MTSSQVDTVSYVLPMLQSNYNQHCWPKPTQQSWYFLAHSPIEYKQFLNRSI